MDPKLAVDIEPVGLSLLSISLEEVVSGSIGI